MISNNKALLTPRSAPNVDEGIESDSTIKQKNNDESIDDSKGVGTKGGYSVNSVGTISAGVDVGVLFNNKVVSTKGIKGDVSLPVIRSSLVTTSIVLERASFQTKRSGLIGLVTLPVQSQPMLYGQQVGLELGGAIQ